MPLTYLSKPGQIVFFDPPIGIQSIVFWPLVKRFLEKQKILADIPSAISHGMLSVP